MATDPRDVAAAVELLTSAPEVHSWEMFDASRTEPFVPVEPDIGVTVLHWRRGATVPIRMFESGKDSAVSTAAKRAVERLRRRLETIKSGNGS